MFNYNIAPCMAVILQNATKLIPCLQLTEGIKANSPGPFLKTLALLTKSIFDCFFHALRFDEQINQHSS